ncbi:hypothetical protein PR048_015738 [Dryococelus australis]|uniref:YqaJ viral recombinase domain-containing protein n=1 Tax=Dryococelus australis TaxID=614101 RepID=A0ABQ9HIV3_9NEOP|nr:hypothetical protein PR048_015738 [Dryococelus australis]
MSAHSHLQVLGVCMGNFLAACIYLGSWLIRGRMAAPESSGTSGDRDVPINSLIASMHKALNWCAVLPSITRLYETPSGDPTILRRNNRNKGLMNGQNLQESVHTIDGKTAVYLPCQVQVVSDQCPLWEMLLAMQMVQSDHSVLQSSNLVISRRTALYQPFAPATYDFRGYMDQSDTVSRSASSTRIVRASEAINSVSISTQYCVLANNIPHLHDDTELKGRRILDIGHIALITTLLSAAHSPTWKQPKKHAKVSRVQYTYFKCKNCNIENKTQTESYAEEETCINIITAAVSGSIVIGVGFLQLGELFDMPFMRKPMWNTRQEQVEVANKEMEKSAKDVAPLVCKCGDVFKEYFPLITVVADCMWGKRYYRSKYNSLSGLATELKKVLHLEVRNKYYAICDRKRRKSNIPPHKCYKSWTGASTAMEADGIVAGFAKGVPLHGIKYARLVGDGDSSVQNELIGSLPSGPYFLLRKDILNVPYHVFGDRTHCPERGYFCNGPKPKESNEKLGFFTEIQLALNRVAHHTNSLIEDVDNNCVEQFNYLVAKTIGGKRINFSMSQSFQNRYSTKLRQRRKKPVTKILLTYSKGPDGHYGPHTAEPLPDTLDDKLAVLKEECLKSLKEECTDEKRRAIQSNKKNQTTSKEWREQIRERITAPWFGKIRKMRTTTSCASVVEYICYPRFSGNADTRREYPYLGATPDGVIEESAIVEMKCPSLAKYISPEEAFTAGNLKFLRKENDTLRLKEQHPYFYQVQGQLNITEREVFYFAVWTSKGLLIDKVKRRNDMWQEIMLSKLSVF